MLSRLQEGIVPNSAKQFQQEDSQEIKTIDIDHPAAEPEVTAPPSIPTPELEISPTASTITSSGPPDSATKPGDEFISPAFIKRARTSYGSLFDSDYDPFAEEDGSVRGKGRKRTRLSSTWRYSSRSPTPEAEEEVVEPVIARPEFVAKSTPAMTDEGCQTVDLEDSGAAETLATFARQSINVGRDSYPFMDGIAAPENVPQSGIFFGDTLMGAESRAIPTQHMNGLQRMETNQMAPQSPHIQPVSSNFLPQVSPLLSKNTQSPANLQSPEGVENSHNLTVQPQMPNTGPQMTSADAEDLYGASPTGRRGEQTELDVPNIHDLAANVNGREPPNFRGQYEFEDQYGHWQGCHHLSHHASPYPVAEAVDEDAQADRFYVEEGGEEVQQYDHVGIPEAHADMLHSHQYPEIDDGLPDPRLSEWGHGDSSVPYPELQSHIIGLENEAATHPPLPRSVEMSRYQSGQSQVVDLTESSDEEEAGLAEGVVEDDGSLLEGGEGSEEGVDEEDSLDEEDDQDEQVAEIVRGRHFPRKIPHEHDIEGDRSEEDESEGDESEGEEQYHDGDGSEEKDDGIDKRFNVGPGQEFYDEEEGSYESEDEDMEDARQPAVQREPEVIDLLSSDDEDSGPPPQLKPTNPAPSRFPQALTEGEDESEASEEDEKPDAESGEDVQDYVPYTGLVEFRIPTSLQEESSSEEDEILADEREQDNVDEDVEEHENESEIEAENEEAVARESLEEPSSDQLLEDRQGEDQDVVGVDVVLTKDHHLEQENFDDTVPAGDKSYVSTAIPGQFGRSQTSPTKSSVFLRMFNFDGANDDPEEDLSYPFLPQVEPSPPASNRQADSQTHETFVQLSRTAQLPTPDATQSFGKTISTETSFTSTIEQQKGPNANTGNMETEQVEIIVEMSAPLDVGVEVGTLQTETTAVTTETAQITIDVEDVEMTQENTLKAIVEPISTEDEPAAEETVEEPVAEVHEIEHEHALDDTLPESMEVGPVEEQHVENEQSLKDGEPDEIEYETVPEQVVEKVVGELDLIAREPRSIDSEVIQEQVNRHITKEEHVLEVAEVDLIEPGLDQEQIDKQIVEAVEAEPVQPVARDSEPAEVLIAVEESKNTEDSITVVSSPRKQIETLHVAPGELEFTIESPRRSHRRAKPTAEVVSRKENAPPVTPTKADSSSSRHRNELASPQVVLDTRAPPKGHDASIELALEALGSPIKLQHDLRKPPIADLKLRLSRALRTELSEFTALKVLRYHLNQKLDVLAVATTMPHEPQRAKNGPRHYQITFNVTDPSVAPSAVTEIQIFRPWKDALPTIQAGDGILLRNFQVISVKGRGFGLRSVTDEGSSWAVFNDDSQPEIRGPPVEFGEGEKNHILALKAWYSTLDAAAMAKITRANGDKAGAGVGKSMTKAS